MPQYRWTRGEPFRDHRNERMVSDGEVVELPENIAGPQPGFVEVDEPPDEPDESDGDTNTCLGNDGECSREVADGEDYCWQHTPEE